MSLTVLQRTAIASLVLLSLLLSSRHTVLASAAHGSRVLYAANWHQGIRGWMRVGELSDNKYGDWTVKGGYLWVSAKSRSDNAPSALVAPISMVAGRPYTVEARIRVMSRSLGGYYGIFAAASLRSDPVYGRNTGVDGIFAFIQGSPDSADLASDLAAPGLMSSGAQTLTGGGTTYSPGRSWHVYRLSVRGSRFVLTIDGKTYATASASSYRNRPRVGVFAGLVPIEVQSFRVLTP